MFRCFVLSAAMWGVFHPRPAARRLLRRRGDVCVARLLEKAQAVLHLGDAKLQLLVLGAEDESELTQETVHAGAGALGDARGVAAPARREIVDRGPGVVA